MSIGLLAELMTDYFSRDEESYSIKERCGHHEPEPHGTPAFPAPQPEPVKALHE